MKYDKPTKKQLMSLCYPHIFCPDKKVNSHRTKIKSAYNLGTSNFLSKPDLQRIISPKASRISLNQGEGMPEMLSKTISVQGFNTATSLWQRTTPKGQPFKNKRVSIDNSGLLAPGKTYRKEDGFYLTAAARHFKVSRKSMDSHTGRISNLLEDMPPMDRTQDCLVQRRSRYSQLYISNDK